MSPATQRRNHSAFGSKRERAVMDELRLRGYEVFRSAGSKRCDVIAGRDGELPRLIEVKGTARSPWVAWGPADRERLRLSAMRFGAVPLLAWWPPHGPLQWIGESEWPSG